MATNGSTNRTNRFAISGYSRYTRDVTAVTSVTAGGEGAVVAHPFKGAPPPLLPGGPVRRYFSERRSYVLFSTFTERRTVDDDTLSGSEVRQCELQ